MGDVWTTPTIGSSMRAGADLPRGQGDLDGGPGVLESIGLGWQRARSAPDWGFNQRNYEEQIAFDLYKPLLEKGYLTQPLDDSVAARIGRTFRGKEDPFWAAVAKARADGLTLPHGDVIDARSMTAEAHRMRRGDMEAADTRLANGSTIGALGGELLAGLADPTSYIPVGGASVKGASLARSILTMGRNEALANLGLGILMEPAVRADAQALGVERGMGDTALDLTVQAGAGFVLGGIGGGVEHLLGGRARSGPVGDEELRADFDRLVPPANQTGEERAAGTIVENAISDARLSPFVPAPAGDDVHAERMTQARDWIFGVRLPQAQPVRRINAAELAGGVTGNLRHGERSRYKAMVRQAESGGDDRAPATTSSAYGRYQPIKSTWLGWWKQRYPGSGLSDEQILAKRADGALQEIFMEDFTANNARRLREAGLPETAENLYLAHFLGPRDATRVLTADPAAPISGLVRGKSIAANRSILEGRTAGDVRAWAARKMGGQGGAGPVDVPAGAGLPEMDVTVLAQRRDGPDLWARMTDDLGDGAWLEDMDMPRLRLDLFDSPESHARAQIEMEAEIDAREGFDIVDRWTDADEAGSGVPVAQRRSVPRGRMDLMQFLASRGGLVPEGVAADAARPAGARVGHDLPGHFGENPFIPGMGRLLREKGLTLDEARELAVEAGYFGDPRRTDVTVSDLLEAMDRQHRGGDRIYAGADMAEMEARRQRIEADDHYQEFFDRLGDAAHARGLGDLTQEDALRAFELWDGEDFDGTLDRLINEHLDAAHMDALAEHDPDMHAELRRIQEQGDDAGRGQDGRIAGDAGGRPAVGADARQGRTGDSNGRGAAAASGQAADDAVAQGGLTPADLARWDEPDRAAAAQLMSIEHDVRGWAKADPDQGFALEEGGEPRALADILADIDEEEAAIAAMEACL
ncbi:hypothetical protein [Sphingobium yanoikuyae]|uniref:hypothetical protein n=1 Tax=Sphingobium yanoikuyae TaxID=13690 RepID=UPI0035B4AF7C